MADDPLKKLLAGDGKEDAGDEDPELDAAKDMLAAFKANDATALSLALKRHYEACKGSDDYEDDEDDDEED
ncbi:MAG TPA: hypothetical protein VFN70_18185 [Burkholderiales bacterium]|nr:hypothetical protein [Burkholderiales bacterium]